jgi:hypothetical protein
MEPRQGPGQHTHNGTVSWADENKVRIWQEYDIYTTRVWQKYDRSMTYIRQEYDIYTTGVW